MTDLLPEYSRQFQAMQEGIRSVTWDKWLWAIAPFAAALVQPLIEKIFPQWGDGRHLLTVTATRGATVRQHLWLKGLPLAGTLVVGVTMLSQSVILPSLALLALAFGGAVWISVDQRRARTQVTFFHNRFRLLGVTYQYDDIAMVVDGPLEDPVGTKVLKWKEFEVTLTKTQYQILRPCLERKKPVNAPTIVSS